MVDRTEYCTVVEYRVGRMREVKRRSLGMMVLAKGEDTYEKARRYLYQVCEKQGKDDFSVVMVTREAYGVNKASFVCKGGRVVKSEGFSGCFRADELIGEFQPETTAGCKSWLRKVLRRKRHDRRRVL